MTIPTSIRPGRAASTALALLVLFAAVACRRPDPPVMTIDAIKAVDWAVTGVALDVTFKVRNPNPKPLRFERFDYDLYLNGQLIGHGYGPNGMDLAGFAEQKVSSRLDVSFLTAPFAIKEIFKQKNALAKAKGNFYVKRGFVTAKVPFDRDMDFTLRDATANGAASAPAQPQTAPAAIPRR